MQLVLCNRGNYHLLTAFRYVHMEMSIMRRAIRKEYDMTYKDIQDTRVTRRHLNDTVEETGYDMLSERGLLFSCLQRFATVFGAAMPV